MAGGVNNTSAALNYLGGDASGGGGGDGGGSQDDAGFSTEVGTLADVDASLEEAALCLQHAESYTRFIQHTVREVNKARALRHKTEQDERRMERERREWSTGMNDSGEKKDDQGDGNDEDLEDLSLETLSISEDNIEDYLLDNIDDTTLLIE